MRSRKNRSVKSRRSAKSRSGSSESPEGQILVLSERSDSGQVPHSVRLPLLPLRSDVVFPQTVVPLVVNRQSGIRLIDELMGGDRMVGLVTQRHAEIDDPSMNDLYPLVCIGSVLKMLKFPDGS